MNKLHRTSNVWLAFVTILLLPSLACTLLGHYFRVDQAGNNIPAPGFDTIEKVEAFQGTGSSETTLSWGLYTDAMTVTTCKSETVVTLQILPLDTPPADSGLPTVKYAPNEYYFTTEILDPIPTFQPSQADKNVAECVQTDVYNSESIKVNGYYSSATKQFTPEIISISRPGCELKDIVIQFNELGDAGNGYDVPLQSISGQISCATSQTTYKTSFQVTQLAPQP